MSLFPGDGRHSPEAAGDAEGMRTRGGLSVEAAGKALAGRSAVMGRELVYLESTDSTNLQARRLAAEGWPEGTVVVAEQQTSGRGRLGRLWFSPPGRNLYMSALVRPSLPVSEAPILTLLAGVACAKALRTGARESVSLKWPNDLMARARKLGGILTELSARHYTVSYAVIGIGINVNLTADEFPDEVRPLATSLREITGEWQDRTLLLAEVLAELDRWYRILGAEGKPPILAEWTGLNETIGKEVIVTTPAQVISGNAEAIDSAGRLLVRLPDGSVTAVSSGDVTVASQS